MILNQGKVCHSEERKISTAIKIQFIIREI